MHVYVHISVLFGGFLFFLEKLCHQNIKWKEKTIETNLLQPKVLFGLYEEVNIIEVVIAILKYFCQSWNSRQRSIFALTYLEFVFHYSFQECLPSCIIKLCV